MTDEEKSKAVSDFCNGFFDANEAGCFGCPLAKDVGDCTDRSEEENYDILVKAGYIKPKVDEAHERFMKIGEIKDSGNRREFDTGAVRDMAEGKGRCDLMPLDIVARVLNSDVLVAVDRFKETDNADYLDLALEYFAIESNWVKPTMLLEVAKHFEEGAKKYGENNWQKGLPINCYIDSAVRHYLKWRRGDADEPHDRAFVWNILCCAWTVKHIEEAKK